MPNHVERTDFAAPVRRIWKTMAGEKDFHERRASTPVRRPVLIAMPSIVSRTYEKKR
jgi:hypothetical protein